MLIKKQAENINEVLGISNERWRALHDLLHTYFHEAIESGVFDGAKMLLEIQDSGKVQSQEEWCGVFYQMGAHLTELKNMNIAIKGLATLVEGVTEAIKNDPNHGLPTGMFGFKKPGKKIIN